MRSGRYGAVCGFSLIELLCCIVIIAILTTISVAGYQGSLDNQDLKHAAPAVAFRLEALRQLAATEGEVITVDFKIGTDSCHVTRNKGGQTTYAQSESMTQQGLMRRNLRFLKYEWPDGSSTPATFTFTGTAAPQGGRLHFGTGHAEAIIRVAAGHVVCN